MLHEKSVQVCRRTKHLGAGAIAHSMFSDAYTGILGVLYPSWFVDDITVSILMMTKGRKQTTEPIFETVILRKKNQL